MGLTAEHERLQAQQAGAPFDVVSRTVCDQLGYQRRRPGADPRIGRSERVKESLQFDYTTVGHVSIDVLADGTRQPGGAAFYSALQAARLGCSAQIITQGVAAEIEQLLDPYRGELELKVLPAPATTTLVTSGSGAARVQLMQAWAGAIASLPELDTKILHLAPIAREIPLSCSARYEFLGITPQGLARSWQAQGEIRPAQVEPAAAALAKRADAIVLSELERDGCAELIAAARKGGALVLITDGERASTILQGEGSSSRCAVPPLTDAIEDLGAGDVFAAALFILLTEGTPARAAVRFATAAAAVRMSARGAGAIGDHAKIEARLQAVSVAGD